MYGLDRNIISLLKLTDAIRENVIRINKFAYIRVRIRLEIYISRGVSETFCFELERCRVNMRSTTDIRCKCALLDVDRCDSDVHI